ncbi:MAG TPA: HEAT repeat domain-containing protein [Vicinamibacteria bacterium]|nr:HEAT repeat domain-containing protein [Vicinamibacteria bacterium]
MEPLFGVIAAAIAASVAYLLSSERRRAQRRTWRRAAERAGLAGVEEAEGGLFEGGFLAGTSGPLRVRLESYRRGKYENGTKIVVTGLGHGAGGLSLRREGLSTAFEKRFVGEREIEIGDPWFDEEYYVQGQAPLALALLDPGTRRSLGGLLRGRVAVAGRRAVEVDPSLSDGVLEVRVKESGFTGNRERVPEILAGVLEVARRLVRPPDVAARIAENLRTEPEAGARLRGVLTLAREFHAHPATREALLAARADASAEVRLRAASSLGEEGRETLLDLVEAAGTDDSCAARAVAALGNGLPPERAEAALRRALGGVGRPQTAQACLEALALLGRTEAEGLILEALRSEDGAVALAAARAIGKVGTVAAVAALRESAEQGGERRRAARQAIAEIQARLTGAEPGQLSLAGGAAGALSLADGEPGRLSLAEGPPSDTEEEPGNVTPKRERKGEGVGS